MRGQVGQATSLSQLVVKCRQPLFTRAACVSPIASFAQWLETKVCAGSTEGLPRRCCSRASLTPCSPSALLHSPTAILTRLGNTHGSVGALGLAILSGRCNAQPRRRGHWHAGGHAAAATRKTGLGFRFGFNFCVLTPSYSVPCSPAFLRASWCAYLSMSQPSFGSMSQPSFAAQPATCQCI